MTSGTGTQGILRLRESLHPIFHQRLFVIRIKKNGERDATHLVPDFLTRIAMNLHTFWHDARKTKATTKRVLFMLKRHVLHIFKESPHRGIVIERYVCHSTTSLRDLEVDVFFQLAQRLRDQARLYYKISLNNIEWTITLGLLYATCLPMSIAAKLSRPLLRRYQRSGWETFRDVRMRGVAVRVFPIHRMRFAVNEFGSLTALFRSPIHGVTVEDIEKATRILSSEFMRDSIHTDTQTYEELCIKSHIEMLRRVLSLTADEIQATIVMDALF